jgi:hypothetical protein
MRCVSWSRVNCRIRPFARDGVISARRGSLIGPKRSAATYASPRQASIRRTALGAVDEGEAEVENALWRIHSAYDKLHNVVALSLSVPSLRLRKDRKGVQRFESDRRRNRAALRGLDSEAASKLLEIDVQIWNHRGI